MATAVRAGEATPGNIYRPADGPPAEVEVIGLASDGRVTVRHRVTGGVLDLDPSYLLVAVEVRSPAPLVAPTNGPALGATRPPVLGATAAPAPVLALGVGVPPHVVIVREDEEDHAPASPEPEFLPGPPDDEDDPTQGREPALGEAKVLASGGAKEPAGASGCVTRLWGTVKGGADVRLPARHTLVLGDNAAGKSTLVALLELALRGGCSDLAGRSWAAATGLLAELIDPRVHTALEAGAEVTLADGRTETFRFHAGVEEANKTGLARPQHQVPAGWEADLPLRRVADELRGSPERAQRFLLDAACGVTIEEILAEVPPGQAPRVKALLSGNADDTVAQRLLGARDQVAKLAREAKREGERIEAEVKATSGELPLRPTEEGLEAARAAADAAQGTVVQISQAWAARPAPRDPTELATVLARIDALQQEAGPLQAQLDLPDPHEEPRLPVEQRERLSAIRTLARHDLARSDGLCGACAGPRGPLADPATLITEVDALLADAQQQQAARVDRAGLQVRWDRMQEEWTRLHQRKAELAAATVALPPPAETVEEATARQRVAQATHAKLQEAARAWRSLDDRKRQAGRQDADRRDLDYLLTVLDGLIAGRVSDAEVAFVCKVQRHLPSEDRFWLDARSGRYGLERPVGTCGTCSRRGLGLHPDETLPAHYAAGNTQDVCPGSGQSAARTHTRRDAALSGVEWAKVTLALAAACVAPGAVVAPLIPEDRDWAEGGKSLKAALKGLSAYPGQILFPTATVPARGVPKGWGVIVLASDGTVLLNAVAPSGVETRDAMKRGLA